MIMKVFGVHFLPPKELYIIPVHWFLPSPGWIKVNTERASNDFPGLEGKYGIFL